ncbi:MAG: hypothetical protein QM714_16500 [Nocardioides sp.]|uniref:class I SAM-dependent methyltransferase n=1 Tax=Nocardioides sp. TaxID=35761 RepID=UPI0039E69CF5
MSQEQCAHSHYEQMAESWNGPSPGIDHDAPFYGPPLARFSTSVEYGFGAGRLLTKLKPTFGVDSSPAMIERCIQANPDVKLLSGNISTVTLPRPVGYSYAAGGTMNGFSELPELTEALSNIRRNSTATSEFRFDLIAGQMYEDLQSILGIWFTFDAGDEIATCERYSQVGPRNYLHEYMLDAGTSVQQHVHIHEQWFEPAEVTEALSHVGYSANWVQTRPGTRVFSPRAHLHFFVARQEEW